MEENDASEQEASGWNLNYDKAEAMRAYARMTKDVQLELDAAELRLRAERRLGEMICPAKNDMSRERSGTNQPRPTTEELYHRGTILFGFIV
jgi:hypothetical protein